MSLLGWLKNEFWSPRDTPGEKIETLLFLVPAVLVLLGGAFVIGCALYLGGVE